MQNHKLNFWLRHYQDNVALKLPAKEPQAKKPCDKKPCFKSVHAVEQHTKKLHAKKQHAKEPHASKPMKILKQPTNELPELLPHFFSSS